MRRRSNIGSIIFMLIFISTIGGAVFVYNSSVFERNVPIIEIKNNGYWNLKDPLNISINDESGIKSYTITLKSEKESFKVVTKVLTTISKSIQISVDAPKKLRRSKLKYITVLVEATDLSKWNLLKGNSTTLSKELEIDKKRPYLNNITNSYAIKKGGSAVVIFKVNDENLKDFYIETSYGKKFKAQPFYKDGYYISLVAWPVTKDSFRASIVANDKAGNKSILYIPFYLRNKNYRVSNIKLSDKFLDGKIAELAEVFEETQGVDDKLEKFKIINEDVRAKNEKLIHEITSKISSNKIDAFPIKPFYPLKNAAKVASFGDHRLYSYKGKHVSESYHLGLDLASVKMGAIKTQNPSIVVFAEENGIYGNMPILHHGLGLYTLYGHCSNIVTSNDDVLKDGTHFANTGKSGYAMGDHLHFGVLVQGIEVRPEEWMDKKWMDTNINDIINDAKKIIDRAE
ncbi:MAG: peptidoglycan DD-metalloendopeptidase family protein [Helicobacteraceae bacterium]|nr:peptidoglycan DD-metalloendopeptidase family protein [Helicobacteraceae bacterium]